MDVFEIDAKYADSKDPMVYSVFMKKFEDELEIRKRRTLHLIAKRRGTFFSTSCEC